MCVWDYGVWRDAHGIGIGKERGTNGTGLDGTGRSLGAAAGQRRVAGWLGMAMGNELGLGTDGCFGWHGLETFMCFGMVLAGAWAFGKLHERSALGGGGMGWTGNWAAGVGNCIFAWGEELAFGGQGQAFDRILLNSALLLKSRFGNASLFSAHSSLCSRASAMCFFSVVALM